MPIVSLFIIISYGTCLGLMSFVLALLIHIWMTVVYFLFNSDDYWSRKGIQYTYYIIYNDCILCFEVLYVHS